MAALSLAARSTATVANVAIVRMSLKRLFPTAYTFGILSPTSAISNIDDPSGGVSAGAERITNAADRIQGAFDAEKACAIDACGCR